MLNILKKLKICVNPEVNDFPRDPRAQYNYLLGVAMIYMALIALCGLMVYKTVSIGIFLFPVGIFITSILYCLSNATSEVYGFKVARNMMWWFIIASTVFTAVSVLLIKIPSPPDFQHQAAFDLIFGNMPRVYLGGIIGSVYGLYFNTRVVSKLKVKMNGKRYWFRSLVSTAGGEVIYNLITYPIMFLFVIPHTQLLQIILSVSLFKVAMTSIFILPECALVSFLKHKEKIDVYDYKENYKLFKLRLFENDVAPSKPILQIVKKDF